MNKRVRNKHPLLLHRMATIAGFKRMFEQFYGNNGEKVMHVVADEVTKTSDVLVDLNRDQLLYGRDADGEALTPGYLSDPYFEGNFKRARAYFLMKHKLEHDHKMRRKYFVGVQLFPEKDSNVPNLLITGTKFFNHFFITVSREGYTIDSSGPSANDIEMKYGKIYGLALESRKYYYFGWIRPAIWNNLLKYISKK